MLLHESCCQRRPAAISSAQVDHPALVCDILRTAGSPDPLCPTPQTPGLLCPTNLTHSLETTVGQLLATIGLTPR